MPIKEIKTEFGSKTMYRNFLTMLTNVALSFAGLKLYLTLIVASASVPVSAMSSTALWIICRERKTSLSGDWEGRRKAWSKQ